MLQKEFCGTCDAAVCWGCMSEHSEHKFISLDDRATDLKTKVFESMNELENEEKLLTAAKCEILGTIEKHEEEQKILREIFLSEVEKLKQEGLKTIDENCTMMEEYLKHFDDVMKFQQKLRELLSVSNDHLIHQFPSVEERLKKIRTVSDNIKKHQSAVILSINNIASDSKELHTYVSRDLKSVLSDQIWLCWKFWAICRVFQGGGNLSVENVTFDGSGTVSRLNCKTKAFNEQVAHCFPVNIYLSKMKVLILTINKSAFIFNPNEEILTLSPSTSYPTMKDFLQPYYLVQQNDFQNPHWSYWEGGVIKFTHDATFTVPCETIPNVRIGQCCNYELWLFFILSENILIVVDTQYSKYNRIEFPEIERISCVSYMYTNTLFIFAADGETFHTMSLRPNSLQVSNNVKHNWNSQTNQIAVSVNNYNGSNYSSVNYAVTKSENLSNPKAADPQYPYLFRVATRK